MKIGESKEKYVKGKGVSIGMWVKTTLVNVLRKRNKKTGDEYLSEQFKQEWLNSPTPTSSEMSLEDKKVKY